MHGQLIEYPSNGHAAKAYLSIPDGGKGPGVVVLQEWWGLVDHIKDVADRFAAEGFVAMAPDLYHGKTTDSPDEAGRLMMQLNINVAERDLRAAIKHLLSRDETTGDHVGTIGFCMGGQLSLYAACANRQVGACVVYYGVHPDVHPYIPTLQAPVLGFFAEHDTFVPPQTARKLEQDLKDAGKSVDFHIYPDAGHAFFNDSRPDSYHETAAKDTWERTISFLKQHLV